MIAGRHPVESGLDPAPSVGLKRNLLPASEGLREATATSAVIVLKLKRQLQEQWPHATAVIKNPGQCMQDQLLCRLDLRF